MNQAAVSISPDEDDSVERFRPTPWLWIPVALYFLIQGWLLSPVLTDLFDGSSVDTSILVMIALTLLSGLVLAFPLITLEIRTDAENAPVEDMARLEQSFLEPSVGLL